MASATTVTKVTFYRAPKIPAASGDRFKFFSLFLIHNAFRLSRLYCE